MRFRLSFVPLILTMALAGCSGNPAPITNPNLQIEGKTALYARAAIRGGTEALDSVDKLSQERLKQPGADVARIKFDAMVAIGVFEQMGKYGNDLADALAIVDAVSIGQERNDALSRARTILNAMNALIVGGVVDINDQDMRKAVTGLLGNISRMLLQLALVLPPDPAEKPPSGGYDWDMTVLELAY